MAGIIHKVCFLLFVIVPCVSIVLIYTTALAASRANNMFGQAVSEAYNALGNTCTDADQGLLSFMLVARTER